jgi:hypothetical protein
LQFDDCSNRTAIALVTPFPTRPNPTQMFLYADQGKAVDGRSLVEFPSTNITLTHLMAFSINSISLDEEEGGVKWESNLECLNIKGSARALFHIFRRPQFRRLREASLKAMSSNRFDGLPCTKASVGRIMGFLASSGAKLTPQSS